MSPQEMAAIYAPLVGLLGMAFWVGALSQRVKSAERTLADAREDGRQLVRVETLVGEQAIHIARIDSSIEGIHRSLRDLVMMRPSTLVELPGREVG